MKNTKLCCEPWIWQLTRAAADVDVCVVKSKKSAVFLSRSNIVPLPLLPFRWAWGSEGSE